MNDLIIFVLLVGILLHNFAQDTGWNCGNYLAEIVAAVCGAVCFIGKPFADGGAFYRSKKTRESHAGWYVPVSYTHLELQTAGADSYYGEHCL